MLALGDSITVGAQSQLQAAGFAVDARVGRPFSEGLRVLQSLPSIPDVVLVNLGTNGGASAAQCAQLADIVGPQRALTLVTVNIPANPGLAARTNAVLADCAEAAGARLVDWAGYSAANPGVLCPDGMHISCGGASAYARFVVPQVLRTAGGSGDPGPGAPPAFPSAQASASAQRPAPAADSQRAAREAETAAAAEAARLEAERAAERAAAEATRAAAEAEKQRRLELLRHAGGDDPAVVDRGAAPSSYRYVTAAARLVAPSS